MVCLVELLYLEKCCADGAWECVVLAASSVSEGIPLLKHFRKESRKIDTCVKVCNVSLNLIVFLFFLTRITVP